MMLRSVCCFLLAIVPMVAFDFAQGRLARTPVAPLAGALWVETFSGCR